MNDKAETTVEKLRFELEYAIQQLERAADWAPSKMTTEVIKMQCEEARKVMSETDEEVAERETKALMHRLVNPSL